MPQSDPDDPDLDYPEDLGKETVRVGDKTVKKSAILIEAERFVKGGKAPGPAKQIATRPCQRSVEIRSNKSSEKLVGMDQIGNVPVR